MLQRRLYLMNLPYDVTEKELKNLIAPHANLDEIVIPRD
jgi:RNA recognition motif-containing protein